MNGRLVLAATVALVGLALDLWSKEAAFAAVPNERDRIVVVDGFFHLAHVRNSGMAWSLFQGVDREFWVVVRSLLSAGIVWLYVTTALKTRAAWWAHLGFGLLLGGALGNLADNVFAQDGHVRDFLLFFIFGKPFPVFNVADSLITVGAPLLFVHLALQERAAAKAAKRAADDAAANAADAAAAETNEGAKS